MRYKGQELEEKLLRASAINSKLENELLSAQQTISSNEAERQRQGQSLEAALVYSETSGKEIIKMREAEASLQARVLCLDIERVALLEENSLLKEKKGQLKADNDSFHARLDRLHKLLDEVNSDRGRLSAELRAYENME